MSKASLANVVDQNGGMRDAWGYKFKWTEEHQNATEYESLLHTCDELGADVVGVLDELYPRTNNALPGKVHAPEVKPGADDPPVTSPGEADAKSAPPKPARDNYALLRDHHKEHPKLEELWTQVNNVPDWVDWDQIARGQDVYYRYGAAVMAGLTYASLLGGAAGSGAAETLARTGGFNKKTVRRRLLETSQLTLEVTRALENIKPGGDGFASCIRVRLLHATVRRRIMAMVEKYPTYYSVEKHGIPINDADSIGTIGVFSATIIWQSLPRQGIFLREQEKKDYLALWRLVAYYMGVPTEPFSTLSRAKATMETFYLYGHNPSPTSQLHARNIIYSIERSPPTYASREYIESTARWLNGHPLSDALAIGKPSAYYTMLNAGNILLYMAIAYTCRSIPALDRAQIKGMRNKIWTAFQNPEWGLGAFHTFEFKYVPAIGVSTSDDGTVGEKPIPTVFWTADRKALVTLFVVGSISLMGIVASTKAAFWSAQALQTVMNAA